MSVPARNPQPNRDRRVALIALGVSFAMLGLSFAAVPLYRIFCAATGLTGTTQVAAQGATAQGKRHFRVRFDTSVASGLPVSFEPEVPSVEVRTGQTATAFFKLTNRAAHPVSVRASYNVAPFVMGLYFDKIACFCFSEQHLEPGQTLEMPVVFFLDPALEKDETIAGIDELTLSYTYSPAGSPSRPVADRAGAAKTKLSETKL